MKFQFSKRVTHPAGKIGRAFFLSPCVAGLCFGLLYAALEKLDGGLVWGVENHAQSGKHGASVGKYYISPKSKLTSPVEEIIQKVVPGRDAFSGEIVDEEIEAMFRELGASLRDSPSRAREIAKILAPEFRGTHMLPAREVPSGAGGNLEVYRAEFAPDVSLDRGKFLDEFAALVAEYEKITVAEFHILALSEVEGSDHIISTTLDFDLAGAGKPIWRLEKNGHWKLDWKKDAAQGWQIVAWQAVDQTRSLSRGPVFVDVSNQVLGRNPAFMAQFDPGVDYWRKVLDGALGIDVFGNNGVAVGDIDGDGLDDFFVCQPSGLPNRLFHNQGDGTFRDVTMEAGVGVLDSSSMALFADVDNDGDEDLIVITWKQPLLFINNGKGVFSYRKDAFQFAAPPRGAFTAASMADYDRDGFLDLYICSYTYFLAEGSYRLATPYYDADNGPPNVLFHNNGDGAFTDVTEAAGLSEHNHRFSFACAWADYDHDGWPDLYVANDFGRNNLYRNLGVRDGKARFRNVAAQAGLEDVGAGMSVAWFDYNNDSLPDLYVGNMWSAAGQRVAVDNSFQAAAPPDVRALYRRHAKGNSLFRNMGDGTFEEVGGAAGVEMGRWAWSSDAFDFDNDGWQDLYIANGNITNEDPADLESFFWRHVVSQSPLIPPPTASFEDGWRAINRLIREDGTWAGHQRNVFYRNDASGGFDNVSATVGLDLDQDSRAFAVADFDLDGDSDLILKSRTGPQLRILRNDFRDENPSVSFRLVGVKSNRDAVGARVTVETDIGHEVKPVQAGSGFLSEHTKELLFGLGKAREIRRVIIEWPRGLEQTLERIPLNHRIRVEEGKETFQAQPFRSRNYDALSPSEPVPGFAPPARTATWLDQPYRVPDFKLTDLQGRTRNLAQSRGKPVLISLWTTWCPPCRRELENLRDGLPRFRAAGIGLLAVSLDGPEEAARVRSFALNLGPDFPVLIADDEAVGLLNILNKYLFDKNENIEIPSTFLVSAQGELVKVYRGGIDVSQILEDAVRIHANPEERLARSLPFGGEFYAAPPGRNYFQFGIYFSEKGFVEPALAAFEEAVRISPEFEKAHYNLGTLYLNKRNLSEARAELERAIELRSDYPEAHNNLGALLAEEGRLDEAVGHFRAALAARPDFPDALNNLGYTYLESGRVEDARKMFLKALELQPDYPEALNNLGILYAKEEDPEKARFCFESAVAKRPDYAEAANNLAMVYASTGFEEKAVRLLRETLEKNPAFEPTYLTLAQVYLHAKDEADAVKVLRELLHRNPNHRQARKMLEQLRPGSR